MKDDKGQRLKTSVVGWQVEEHNGWNTFWGDSASLHYQAPFISAAAPTEKFTQIQISQE